MEQVLLQRAEVASQLLSGLGDGGAKGRRRSVPAPFSAFVHDAAHAYASASFPEI
jgi:hypothetical protein